MDCISRNSWKTSVSKVQWTTLRSLFCFGCKEFPWELYSLYSELVENMLTSFCILGCNMSIKLHYLHSHLFRFPDYLGDVSNEQDKWFHQEIRTMEERHQGWWDAQMIVNYCWSTQCECPGASHRRKSQKCGVSDMSQWRNFCFVFRILSFLEFIFGF